MGLFDAIDEDIIEDIVNEITEEIAESAVEEAIDLMWSSCVNEGQETLIGDIESDVYDQVEDIQQGDYQEVESDHPEAVGLIMEAANEICSSAAEECLEIRQEAGL